MTLSKPRAIAAILAQPAYEMLKAFCAARLNYHFLPQTDTFMAIALPILGLTPKQDKGV